MHRDATARSRIREHLQIHGPVEDASGHASGVLREAVAYQGSAVAFIQMLAAMARDGEIERTIRGKRTFRIASLVSTRTLPEIGQSRSPAMGQLAAEIDYERLAKAVVNEMAERLVGLLSTSHPAPAVAVPTKMHLAPDERTRLLDERDHYVARLQEARSQIDELLGSAASSTSTGRRSSVEPDPLFRKPADSTS